MNSARARGSRELGSGLKVSRGPLNPNSSGPAYRVKLQSLNSSRFRKNGQLSKSTEKTDSRARKQGRGRGRGIGGGISLHRANVSSSFAKNSARSSMTRSNSKTSNTPPKDNRVKTEVFELDTDNLKRLGGAEIQGSTKPLFFQVFNQRKRKAHKRKAKIGILGHDVSYFKTEDFQTSSADPNTFSAPELLSIIKMKEKEITGMARVIDHLRKGLEARDNTIMRLNREINAMKDLLSLGTSFSIDRRGNIATKKVKKRFIENIVKKDKNASSAAFKEKKTSHAEKIGAVLSRVGQSSESNNKTLITNYKNFNLSSYLEKDGCYNVLRHFCTSVSEVKNSSYFFTTQPQKVISTFKVIKDSYKYKVQAIARLQTISSEFTTLGGMKFDEMFKHVQQVLSRILNCERCLMLLYNKKKDCLYAYSEEDGQSMIKVNSDNALAVELINGQDIKQKSLMHDLRGGEHAEKLFGRFVGIKVLNLISAKIMDQDRLRGKFRQFRVI